MPKKIDFFEASTWKVITPRKAQEGFSAAYGMFNRDALLPIFRSYGQGLSGVGVPTSYGVNEPIISLGFWENSFRWDESPLDTLARVIEGLFQNQYPDGVWVDFQIGFRGGNISVPKGPYGGGGIESTWSFYVGQVLEGQCFRQNKVLVSGTYFTDSLQTSGNPRVRDYRRFPYRGVVRRRPNKKNAAKG